MTFRAVILGLLAGAALSAFGYFNDWVLKLTFVSSDLVPVSVFGLLLIVLVAWNPLLRLVRLRPFNGSELAVIISLLLMACAILGPGLMWGFTNVLALPHQYNQMEPGWRRQHLLDHVPPVMLIDPARDPQTSVTGFSIGLPNPAEMGLGDIPWDAWRRTLWFWLPLLSLGIVGTICLAMLLHQQWSTRERLRYPISQFATQMLQGTQQGQAPTIFRDRKFWMGTALAAGTLLINAVACWYPDSISIPLRVDTWPAAIQKWPTLAGVPNVEHFFHMGFFFIAVGLAYFVESDVSFSIGISPLVYLGLYLALYSGGITLSSGYYEPGPQNALLAGAYIGTGIGVLLMGRQYFLAVLGGAVGLRTSNVEGWARWACRVGLAAAAGLLLVLHHGAGLGWGLSFLFVMLAACLFVVITRVMAETGFFLIQPYWHPVTIAAMLGRGAVDPSSLITLGLLSAVVTVDPRACLMPMVANGLKLSEQQGVRPQRLGGWLIVAALAALLIALVATLYVQYRFGTFTLYEWGNNAVRFPFTMLARSLSGDQIEGGAALAQDVGSGVGLTASWACLGAGLVLALGCRMLRLRYLWWPIHPVLFLVWGTFPADIYAPSMLLCWAIKGLICRLGGAKTYQAYKPFFVGLVAGEFLAAIVWAIVGYIYYATIGPLPSPLFRTHL